MRKLPPTNWLARSIALYPFTVAYKQPAPMSPDEQSTETARLDALPKDEQVEIFCAAMGFPVLDYLLERARFNGEVENELDYLTMDEMGAAA